MFPEEAFESLMSVRFWCPVCKKLVFNTDVYQKSVRGEEPLYHHFIDDSSKHEGVVRLDPGQAVPDA